MPSDPANLDLTAAEREVLGRAALDWVLRWFEHPTSGASTPT